MREHLHGRERACALRHLVKYGKIQMREHLHGRERAETCALRHLVKYSKIQMRSLCMQQKKHIILPTAVPHQCLTPTSSDSLLSAPQRVGTHALQTLARLRYRVDPQLQFASHLCNTKDSVSQPEPLCHRPAAILDSLRVIKKLCCLHGRKE
jgi:hypothetical protein